MYGALNWEISYESMGVWGTLLYSIPFIAGSFVGAYICARALPKRKFFYFKVIATFVLSCIAAYFIWSITSDAINIIVLTLLKYALFFIIIFLALLSSYRINPREALFFTESGVAIFSVSKLTFDIFGCFNYIFDWNIMPYGIAYSVIYLAVCAAVYTAVYFIFIKRNRYFDGFYVDNNALVLATLAIIAVSTVLNIKFGQVIYIYNLTPDAVIYIKIPMFMLSFFILCFNFNVFEIGKKKREVFIIESLNKQQNEQYKMMKASIDLVNIKYHDLKGQLAELKKMAASGKAADEISKVEEEIETYESIADTGNECLDVVLTEKNLYAQKNGIELNHIIDGEKLAFMENIDIISLFGNILNNAIEAVEKIPDGDKRIITLQVYARDSLLFIHSDNYCADIKGWKDGLPLTDKKDKANHGYGLKSIKAVVQKYGGDISLKSENGMFEVNIIFST